MELGNADVVCYKCSKRGHMVARCYTKAGAGAKIPRKKTPYADGDAKNQRAQSTTRSTASGSPSTATAVKTRSTASKLRSNIPNSKTRSSPSVPEAQSITTPHLDSESEEFSDTLDDITLAALSGSRSSSRRQASTPSGVSRQASSSSPIAVNTPSPPPQPSPSSTLQAPMSTKKVSMVDLFGEASCDSDGAISVSIEARSEVNPLLSFEKYYTLPRVRVPRSSWFPGYRKRIPQSAARIAPWSARRVSLTSVAELDVDFFYRHLSRPTTYPFPAQASPVRSPPDSSWSPQLITSSQITALYDQKPWEILNQRIAPVSFQLVGWFKSLAKVYWEFEDRHRQTLWESTHVLPVAIDKRRSDPVLETFYRQRKQRRSRSGPRWKTVLKFILNGMIQGMCDLDILLDPFFLHLPRSAETRMWYPVLGGNAADAADLTTALSEVDIAGEPWRNQYRTSIADHPGSSIPRLIGKFLEK